MSRPTDNAVAELLGEWYNDDTLTPWIDSAESIVDDVCIDSDDYTYTDGKLELIKRWLSAHCYCILSPQAKFKSAGKVQKSTDSKVDLGLNQTRYGQTAMLMDTNGLLAAYNKRMTETGGIKVTPSVAWLGSYPSD